MKVSFTALAPKMPKSNVLIAGYFEKGDVSPVLNQEPQFAQILKTAKTSGRFQGKFGEIFSSFNNEYKKAPEIILIGLGQEKNFKILCAKKAAGHILRVLRERNLKKGRVLIESFAGPLDLKEVGFAMAEVAYLGSYQFNKYKTKNGKPAKKAEDTAIEFSAARAQAVLNKAVQEARVLAEAIIFTRDLINEPANVMNPTTLSLAARKMARASGIRCTVLGKKELTRLKMGGILGVGQGSLTPPALIVLEYGKQYAAKGTICLVGKGVTFDTGGLSIKPPKGMEKMKYDMSGAAAVLGAVKAVAGLKLKKHVIVLAPTAENNINLDPQRPGDIIRMFNGKTVEVLNTDAEGRLILGDALSYSEKYKPAAIIDIATLTGMCAATFADQAIGLMGTDEKLNQRVKDAGERTGERCWELPLWDGYFEQIKGVHSDLKNIGGAYGGTITAAMFLKEFVPEKTPWVHLDIAGTAWCESPRYDSTIGATGVGVRLMTDFVSRWAKD